MPRGNLYIISAPSGAGKTSLVKALVGSESGITVSVSYTTRPMRPGEVDGVNYHFVDQPTFMRMAAGGRFLEYAQVFDHFYGTSRDTLLRTLDEGIDVVLEIDWQGAQQVQRLVPGAIGIFILVPSLAELERRLKLRGEDRDEVIARRMRDALSEISHYHEYDYLIVNQDFDRALADLRAIVRASRLGMTSQRQALTDLLKELMA
jgi:guanylate kinase